MKIVERKYPVGFFRIQIPVFNSEGSTGLSPNSQPPDADLHAG